MKRGILMTLSAATLVLFAGAALVLANAGRGGATTFDLSDLRDGETRVFGAAGKQISVTRDGDVARLSTPATAEHAASEVVCRVSSDSCRVTTFDDSDRVMVEVEKTREWVTDGHDLPDGAHVIVRKIRCDGADCEEFEWTSDGSAHDVEVIVDGAARGGHKAVFITDGGETHVLGGDDPQRKTTRVVRIGEGGPHVAMANLLHDDTAEVTDLADLLDGETRIFGSGANQVTALRMGETVTLTRDESADHRPLSLTCQVGQDACKVIASGDDGDLVIHVEKRRECAEGNEHCAEVQRFVFQPRPGAGNERN